MAIDKIFALMSCAVTIIYSYTNKDSFKSWSIVHQKWKSEL